MHTSFSGTIYVVHSYILLLLFTPKTAPCLGDSGDLCSRCGCHRGVRIFFGRVGSPRTSVLTDMHTAIAITKKKKKKKKEENRRNYRFSSVYTNEGRPKDINRCPLSGVSGVRVRTYNVLRAYMYIHIYIYLYVYIMCILHICGGFSFSGRKSCAK